MRPRKRGGRRPGLETGGTAPKPGAKKTPPCHKGNVMTKTAKTTNARKNRKTAPAEAPALEAFLAPPPEAEAAPAPTPAEAAANAAKAAVTKVAELQAQQATIMEAIRQAKAEAQTADKTAFRAANPRQMSCLDAAYEVLKGFPNGLNAKAIVKRAYGRDLWKSAHGYTPEATIYAGMIREIAAKGPAARFARGAVKGTFIANPLLNPPATA